MREKIELAGREPRWEFSKTALFERSAHISGACGRLGAALATYHGLRQTLGPKLEAMTGSSQVLFPQTNKAAYSQLTVQAVKQSFNEMGLTPEIALPAPWPCNILERQSVGAPHTAP